MQTSLSKLVSLLVGLLLLLTLPGCVRKEPEASMPTIISTGDPLNLTLSTPTVPLTKTPTVTSTVFIAQVTPTSTLTPTLSPIPFQPKGLIVMARNSEFDRGIYLYNPETEKLEYLTPNFEGFKLFWDPTWSPDATQVLFVYERGDVELFQINMDTKSLQQINPQTEYHYYMSPDWSPDGKTIVFNGLNKLLLYSVSTGNMTPLTETAAPDYDGNPAWSPSGEHIAFIGCNSQQEYRCQILTIDKEGQNRKVVTPDISVGWGKISWSPDGKYIAYRSKEGCGDICTVRVDDGSRQCLTDTPGGEKDPSWSPDGAYIAYVATEETELCDQKGGSSIMLDWQLHILQLSNGRDEIITGDPDASYNSPNWSSSE